MSPRPSIMLPALYGGLIIAAMACARTCAMAFNRIVDRKFDALNPRTAARHLPSGEVTLPSAITLCILAAGGRALAVGGGVVLTGSGFTRLGDDQPQTIMLFYQPDRFCHPAFRPAAKDDDRITALEWIASDEKSAKPAQAQVKPKQEYQDHSQA